MKFLQWCYKHRIILIIDIICLLLVWVSTLRFHALEKSAVTQQEGHRWAEDGKPYHQVSAFFPTSDGVTRETISGYRANLQRTLLDASFSDSDVTGKLWTDAYAALSTDSVTKTTQMGTVGKENVKILGVGGDFFLFHPVNLLSGSTFSDHTANGDLVLIDREIAWTLYGSTDIAGQKIYLAGRPFVVSGVYEAEQDKLGLKASDGKSYLMMDYDTFHEIYKEDPIYSYEAVLPNPVKNFALNALQNAVGGENATAVLVDNEDRFKPKSLLARFADIQTLMMHTSPVVFPFWENRMRGLEWQLFCILVLRFFLFLTPLVSAIFALVCFIRQKGARMWHDFWARQKEKLRRRLYERPVKPKVGIEDEDF